MARKSEQIGIVGASFVFAATAAYMLYAKASHHILLAVGATFILYASTSGDLVGAMLAGAMLTLVVYSMYKPRTEGFQDAEEAEEAPKPKAKATKKLPPPDHADRPAEMFELGKKYKMPAEADDKEFHLDAGTTFMNAYKSLKPDQIAAMTKDTQELMETQKQLMGTLQTLKPLIQDGKQMMEMFQSYFGAANPTTA